MPPIEPDPDLSLANPAAGEALDREIRSVEDAGAQIESQLQRLGDAAKGTAAAAAADRLRAEGGRLAQTLGTLSQALELHQAAVAAATAYRANTVAVEDIQAADAAVDKARQVLRAEASGPGWLDSKRALKDAEQHAADLRKRRHDAIEAYKKWDTAAAAEFRAKAAIGAPIALGEYIPPAAPGPQPAPTPPAAPPAAGPAPAPAPSAPPADAPLPGTAAAPATTLSNAGSGSGAALDPASVAVGAALGQAQHAQQAAAVPQQAAMPQMPQIPMAQQPQTPTQIKARGEDPLQDGVFGKDDALAILNRPDPAAAAGTAGLIGLAGLPGSTAPATVASPWTAPAGALSPSVTPAPSPLAGLSAAPPSSSATTGVSYSNLQTDANVTGRSEPVRGPLAPNVGPAAVAAGAGAATHLSGAGNAGGPGAVGGPGAAGAPMAGTPMIPPVMGGLGGAAGRTAGADRDPILAYTPDGAVAHGMHAIAEAVGGATITKHLPLGEEFIPDTNPDSDQPAA